jgi:hypothetical protein
MERYLSVTGNVFLGVRNVALTSSSTLDDALAQYNNNLSWDGDITKANAALEAIRWILANRPKMIATNSRTINFESLYSERDRLEAFVSKFSSNVTRASFTRGHMLIH